LKGEWLWFDTKGAAEEACRPAQLHISVVTLPWLKSLTAKTEEGGRKKLRRQSVQNIDADDQFHHFKIGIYAHGLDRLRARLALAVVFFEVDPVLEKLNEPVIIGGFFRVSHQN
jgi:hypothetical protein